MTDRPTVYAPFAAERDARDLQQLIAQIETGFNQKNAAVLDGPFSDDAVVIVPDGTILRGWRNLFDYHTARLAGPVTGWTTRIEILSISSPAPDLAILHLRQDTTTPQGAFANHGTVVAVKQDGTWWISAMQNTNVA
ncbi:SgcJ/EcaC family oxidoreductase [Nonomuraea sp. NPDC050783]|uniref:SgcJ/EcaC family oxidoreductase n=1 Tax=Nonomuraea sp. NPDC050783 TaxID=3154634 RepID=UPI0034667EBF